MLNPELRPNPLTGCRQSASRNPAELERTNVQDCSTPGDPRGQASQSKKKFKIMADWLPGRAQHLSDQVAQWRIRGRPRTIIRDKWVKDAIVSANPAQREE
jgi:hypothetical protein